jgi:Transposase, Mutator family
LSGHKHITTRKKKQEMTIRRELIDELLKDYETPQDILGERGLLKELTKAVIERCLETELDTHLGYPRHGRKGNAAGNMRNGHSQKTLKGGQGHVDIKLPRDRQGSFEPQLVKKGQTAWKALMTKFSLYRFCCCISNFVRLVLYNGIHQQLHPRTARKALTTAIN